jgi:uncharacterized protein YaiE (UPF0345 family)
MSEQLALPDTSQPPDNTYFDTQVISWDFSIGEHKATLGVIQPGFKEDFTAAEGGEQITLHKPEEDAVLSIFEVDASGRRVGNHELRDDGDTVYIPEGNTMRVRTASKIVEYICEYPGQSAAE